MNLFQRSVSLILGVSVRKSRANALESYEQLRYRNQQSEDVQRSLAAHRRALHVNHPSVYIPPVRLDA